MEYYSPAMLQDIQGWVTAAPISDWSRAVPYIWLSCTLARTFHIYHARRAYFLHILKYLYHHEHTYSGFLNINAQYNTELPPYAVHLADKAPLLT